MSEPTFYSWDDVGIEYSRVLTGNLQDMLKQILVQCLVTGYGRKRKAGWTLGHEHANGFSLINADGNVVNFVSNLPDMNNTAIHIYAAESITDTSNAVIDGANLCSGPYRKGIQELDGNPRHVIGQASNVLKQEQSTLQWTLVADEKTFVLNCSSKSSGIGNYNNGYYYPDEYSFTVYVGEVLLDTPVSGNFVALGGSNESYVNTRRYMHAYMEGNTTLRDLSTGLIHQVEVGAHPYLFSPTVNSKEDTVVLPSRINFQQPRVVSGDVIVGRLRGVAYDDVLRHLYGWEVGLKALGFTGTDYTDRGKPVKIGDYSYAFARSYSGNSYLTDNPEFW